MDTTESERLLKECINIEHDLGELRLLIKSGKTDKALELLTNLDLTVNRELRAIANDSDKSKASGVRVNALVRCIRKAINDDVISGLDIEQEEVLYELGLLLEDMEGLVGKEMIRLSRKQYT